ncbi:hypothetical protein E5V00_001276 [Neisseria gonorrhoeae]
MPDNLILISVLAKPSPTHARKTLIGGYHIAAFQTDLDGRIDRMRADLPSLTMVKLGKPLPRKGGIQIGFDIALSVGENISVCRLNIGITAFQFANNRNRTDCSDTAKNKCRLKPGLSGFRRHFLFRRLPLPPRTLPATIS